MIVLKPAGVPITCGTANVPRVSTKITTADVAIAGARSGTVTVRSTVIAAAPEAWAARSVIGSALVARPTVMIK